MKQMNQSISSSFVVLVLVFLIIGFVQQGYQISFDSGFFNLGLFFLLGETCYLRFKKKIRCQREVISIA
jgi:hypothetical protein